MKDHDAGIFFIVALTLFVLAYLLGFTLAENRIYDNCLEANATMIHKDAVAKCKEFIK